MARLALPLLLALAACATPQAPSGGPRDTTPPRLVETRPADGATDVSDPAFVLVFSERLDAASGRAVRITPEGDEAPVVRVRARQIEVGLPALRDSTTYVVTVGTELRDQRGVALRAPLTLAFATGPTIDRGRIAGVVRGPETDTAVGSMDVWAYALTDTTALPDVRTVAPDYRTQTGADGAFRLEYLRPGPYFVAAVADRNRNGRADAGERFAAPPRPILRAAEDSAAEAPPVRFWTARLDTIPPEARRVQVLSGRRLGVRFSEAVRLGDPAAVPLVVADSVSGEAIAVTPYQPPADPFVVLLEVDRPLPPRRHVVRYPGEPDSAEPALADSAGLAPLPFALGFTPPERPDTTRSRFLGFLAASDTVTTLGRGQRPGVRFTAPPSDIATRVEVEGVEGATFETDDGVTFHLGGTLPPGVTLSVREGDSTFVQRYAVLPERETGGIVGAVETSSGTAFVLVTPAEGGPAVQVPVAPDGRFVIAGLSPGTYRVRVVGDRNGNGRWDGGRLVPYEAPEPLRLLDGTVSVRARWETELDPVDLRTP